MAPSFFFRMPDTPNKQGGREEYRSMLINNLLAGREGNRG